MAALYHWRSPKPLLVVCNESGVLEEKRLGICLIFYFKIGKSDGIPRNTMDKSLDQVIKENPRKFNRKRVVQNPR